MRSSAFVVTSLEVWSSPITSTDPGRSSVLECFPVTSTSTAPMVMETSPTSAGTPSSPLGPVDGFGLFVPPWFGWAAGTGGGIWGGFARSSWSFETPSVSAEEEVLAPESPGPASRLSGVSRFGASSCANARRAENIVKRQQESRPREHFASFM